MTLLRAAAVGLPLLAACHAPATDARRAYDPPVERFAYRGKAQEPSVHDPAVDELPEEEADEPRGFLGRFQIDWRDLPELPRPENVDVGGALVGSTKTVPEEVDEEGGGDLLVAPIPFVSPTIGYGLALGGAYLVKLDEDSPPSTIGAGALYSQNGSYGAGVFFKGYFAGDRVRVTTGLVAARLNFDLSVSDDTEVPLRENVLAYGLEVLIRCFERLFLGPQILVAGVDTDIVKESDAGAIPDDELDTFNISLGLRGQRDTRDSTFYPRSGSLADVQLRVFDDSWGSAFNYQVLPIAYNHYLSPGPRDVVALRAYTRLAFGDVPFYGQSYFGTGSDLRGYVIGTSFDDALGAVQGEYRRELAGRLGAVGFAGVGAVAPTFGELFEAEALPSVGLGVRFLLEKENHVNLRIDYAWGRDQSALYLAVGEAF